MGIFFPKFSYILLSLTSSFNSHSIFRSIGPHILRHFESLDDVFDLGQSLLTSRDFLLIACNDIKIPLRPSIQEICSCALLCGCQVLRPKGVRPTRPCSSSSHSSPRSPSTNPPTSTISHCLESSDSLLLSCFCLIHSRCSDSEQGLSPNSKL